MTQCTKALIDYAFNELKLNRVEIRASVENKKPSDTRTIRFYKRRSTEKRRKVQGQFKDSFVYSLLKSEWQSYKRLDNYWLYIIYSVLVCEYICKP